MKKLSFEVRKQILRWIMSHNDPECKMSKIQVVEENNTTLVTCNCGELLDITEYKVEVPSL